MVELALARATDAPIEARANKLAFVLLTTVPSSPVARLLGSIAERAFARAGAAFGSFIDADDLLSLLRWRLWTLAPAYFTSSRILKHPGLAAYLSVIGRRIVIDECRAMDNRARSGIEPETIEASIDARATLDAILDDLDLLRRFGSELPEWQSPLVEVLAGQADRDDALHAINRKRDQVGLPPWSPEAMRTAVHRARIRLRELLTKTPSPLTPEPARAAADSARSLHSWRRFWCAREGMYSLGDDGFLVDPETAFGRHVHDVHALESLADVPCLALLGEPGIGKSTAMRQEAERLAAEGHLAVFVDLAETSARNTLHREVERACATSSSPAYLFFDALDEGLARNPALTTDLVAATENVDLSRIRVRISCRALEWPRELEEDLRERSGTDAVRVLELLPLRRIDVIAAANDLGVDGVAFVRAVRDRDAMPLAIRPISLRFLLAMFVADGTLPHSRARLFDEGTLILCAEEGALQRGRGRRNPDVYRRRAIAARVAAASTFTNLHSIVRGEIAGDGVLPASLLAGAVEKLPGASYDVDVRGVEDVLAGTALFSPRSATTYGWSHQSYREFLAAWYLAQHGVEATAAQRLYMPDGLAHVPEPLREVAAWHATLVPALFDEIVERDPDVLLHSEGAALSENARGRLVLSLLERMARFELLDRNYNRRDYQKLAHPHLAQQLRPYITDRRSNIIVRRAAMDIAWSCGVQGLVDELIAVLADRADELQAREVAARALAQLGGDRVRDTFIAVLAAGFEPDPNDSIRGSILSFLWPEHIDVRTMFRHLAMPQRHDYLGVYQRFIDEFPAGLRPQDLQPALQWVAKLDGAGDHHLRHAQHEIIDVALRFAERDEVRAELVRLIRAAFRRGGRSAWSARGSHRDTGRRFIPAAIRRLFARDLIETVGDEDVGIELVLFHPPLIGPDDLEWITGLVPTAEERVQRACGHCVAAIYRQYGYPTDPAVVDAVSSIESAAFREPLRAFLDPVVLGSDEARALAERWSHSDSGPETEPDDEQQAPTRWSVAAPWLDRAEAGETGCWIDFVYRWGRGFPTRIADVDEWATLAPADRERIVLAGLRYLADFEAPNPSWLDDANSFPWSAAAARMALQMIAATRPAFLGTIEERVWRTWCPVLVALTHPSLTSSERSDLVHRCASFEELADTIVKVVRRDSQRGDYVSAIRELPDPVPAPLQVPLLSLAPDLGDVAFEEMVELLGRGGDQGACELARVALRDAAPERAARAARVILPHDPEQWSVVVERMQRDPAFTAAFAPLLSFPEDTRDNPFANVGEQQAAEICLAALRQYPREEDAPLPDGTFGLIDHVERLARRMISVLVERGTEAAVRALEWLAVQEPALRFHLIEAKQKHADKAWRPLSLDDLWKTLNLEETTNVESGDDADRCVISLRPGSDPMPIKRLLIPRLPAITVDGEQLVAVAAQDAIPGLVAFIESAARLRDSVLTMRVSGEVVFETVRDVVLASPERRDAGAGEIMAMLRDVHVLLETATNVETAAVHAAMKPVPGETALVVGSVGVATYTIGLLGNYAVAHLQTDMGNESPNAAQLATNDAIRDTNPKLVLLVGIAFGLQRKKQRLGDVLVAQHVRSYEMIKLRPDSIEERGETLRADTTMVERIRAHGRSWTFPRADGSAAAFHVGDMLSGDKLVNSREFRDTLVRRFATALGGEMEGVGAYAAASRHRVPVLLVKAICDWADGAKNDRAQSFAAAAATDLVRHVLAKPDVLAALGIFAGQHAPG